MVLQIHYGGDSEILNYEYERANGILPKMNSHQIVLMKVNII